MESDAKTNLLAAALHFNPELKQEVEDWVQALVVGQLNRVMMNDAYFVEQMLRNNMFVLRRVLHDAQMETMRRIDMNKSIL